MKLTLSVALLLLLSGCAILDLSVFTEYVSIESLPSYQIGTPDPRLYCPDYGARLHISWRVPNDCHYNTLYIHLRLIFGNREEEEVYVDLFEPTGTYVYSLLNDTYWAKSGVLTYRVDLYGDDSLLKSWIHQLWAERICLDGDNIAE